MTDASLNTLRNLILNRVGAITEDAVVAYANGLALIQIGDTVYAESPTGDLVCTRQANGRTEIVVIDADGQRHEAPLPPLDPGLN